MPKTNIKPNLPLVAVPRLIVSSRLKKPERVDSVRSHVFRYRSKIHGNLPHVLKFSGGQSSGMLLFILLENAILKAERGDIIIFNNTSCEHPNTYKFVAECKKRVEEEYGLPFFWIEFQTYEDARHGDWTRLSSYRMVNHKPYSEDNPHGFHWRGEVYEELLSHDAYVPNQFTRTCTATLKLEATRLFLRDWFAGKEFISRLGHGGEHSRIEPNAIYKRHLKHRGGVPRDIFLRKKEYVLRQPPSRPKQYFKDFSFAVIPFKNPVFKNKVFGNKAWLGSGGIEYVALIGIRGDEGGRVAKVEARREDTSKNASYEGEHVYMPLFDMRVTREDVNDFWEQQCWGLKLPKNGALSNCIYCFLKGIKNLEYVHKAMEQRKKRNVRGFGSTKNTPCDANWWNEIEKKYGRDLHQEGRELTGSGNTNFIGFFNNKSGFSYQKLVTGTAESKDLSSYANTVLPCDCTE